MNRTLIIRIALASLVAGPISAAPRPKAESEPEGDLKRMQGSWLYVSQTIGGRSINEKDRGELWVNVDGDLMAKSGNLKYKIVLDLKTNPKGIDLVSHEHPSGKTFIHKGIYEWDGETLRFCFDNTGTVRPKEFNSPAGKDNIYLSVLKRKAK